MHEVDNLDILQEIFQQILKLILAFQLQNTGSTHSLTRIGICIDFISFFFLDQAPFLSLYFVKYVGFCQKMYQTRNLLLKYRNLVHNLSLCTNVGVSRNELGLYPIGYPNCSTHLLDLGRENIGKFLHINTMSNEELIK